MLAASFTAAPLFSQVQIGGGICTAATLTGNYSLTISGRAVSPTLAFTKISQGVGTATFDGVGKVALNFANNTLQATGTAQTWSGSYTLQSNCTGSINLIAGDTATFALEAYNSGKSFLITGQDGTFALTGNGTVLPTTTPCSAAEFNGTYAVTATGFFVNAGAVSGVNDISGLLLLDGKSAITGTLYVAGATTNTTLTVSGQFAVTAACTGSGTVTDSSGNSYTLQFTDTGGGSGFLLSGANPTILFIGNGRTL